MDGKEKTYTMELRNLEELLCKKLGNEIKVENFEAKPLLSFGENYGSTMLKVNAKIRRRSDADVEELHLVAKMLPGTDFQRQIFSSWYTFKKEAFLYEELIPSYKQLERELKVDEVLDIVPEFYGARFSLSSDEVDEDAVILMKNLKVSGYYTADRFKGIDLEHAKVAAAALAYFHGQGMAMKTHKPGQFEIIKMRSKCLENDEEDDFSHFLELAREDSEMSKYYERLELCVSQDSDRLWYDPPPEPWSTIIHSDFWINNFLFRRQNGKITDIKFVDFQNYLLMSPLRELVFFLCMNLQFDVMENNFDELIDYYYDNFIKVLKKMKCDVEPFAREKFDERLKIDAYEEFPHIPLMLRITNLDSDYVKEASSVEDVIFGTEVNSVFLNKLRICVKKYVDKKWL